MNLKTRDAIYLLAAWARLDLGASMKEVRAALKAAEKIDRAAGAVARRWHGRIKPTPMSR